MADVMEHLRGVRRRLNSLTIQHAVAVCSAALLLVIAGLIVLALHTPARVFAPLAGIALIVLGVVAAIIAWRVWRAWLSLERTAHLADRRAGLNDRLATLLAASGPRGRSAFLPLLVDQTLARVAEWGASALAPRRFTRSLAFLPIALAVLLVTAFYARPPARPAATTTQLAANQRRNVEVPDAGSGIAPAARKADAPRGSGPDSGVPEADAPEGIEPPVAGGSGEPDPGAGEMITGGDTASQSDDPSAQVEGAGAESGESDGSEGSEDAGAGSEAGESAESADANEGEPEAGERESAEAGPSTGEPTDSGSPSQSEGEPEDPGQNAEDRPDWTGAPLAALRDVIRNLFDVPPEEVPEGEQRQLAEGPVELAERIGNEDETIEEGVPARPDSEDPDLIEPTDVQAPQDEAETQAGDENAQGPHGGTGSSASSAGTGTTGPEGLYGKPGASGDGGSLVGKKNLSASGGKVIAIRLGASAGGPSEELAGTGDRREGNDPVEAAALAALASGSSLPELAAEQSADAALQKVEVSPEYEAIVRQIFTRE